jgi:hypothetical protein
VRLWSIHPKYLDSKGLVALWREALLAQKVLEGETKGYRNHPQLDRFKACPDPLKAIGRFLTVVQKEATAREYDFNKRKIRQPGEPTEATMPVSTAQIDYEWALLLDKVRGRDLSFYSTIQGIRTPLPNPIFSLREGEIEPWERVKSFQTRPNDAPSTAEHPPSRL